MHLKRRRRSKQFILWGHREMQIKATTRSYLSRARAAVKNNEEAHDKIQWGCGERGLSYTVTGVGVNQSAATAGNAGQCPWKTESDLCCAPAVLPGLHGQEMKRAPQTPALPRVCCHATHSGQDTESTSVPSTDERMRGTWCVRDREHPSPSQRMEFCRLQQSQGAGGHCVK